MAANGNGKGDEERGVTRRVVLRRERVLVVPDGLADDVVKAAQDVIRKADKSKGSGLATEAWVVVGEFDGHSKTAAIETHAGRPGTPDAVVGAYKAPSVRAWAGGEEYVKPALPKVERTALA